MTYIVYSGGQEYYYGSDASDAVAASHALANNQVQFVLMDEIGQTIASGDGRGVTFHPTHALATCLLDMLYDDYVHSLEAE